MEGNVKKISQRVERQRARVHEQVMNNLAVLVRGLEPQRILDVGTGYGSNLNFLARRFGKQSHIWSVDVSPVVVREMRKMMSKRQYSCHVVVKKASAERLPFETGRFDLVVSVFSLHHLSNPMGGLFEMTRVLSKGGQLIISDWRPAAARPLLLHARSEMPSPSFVTTELKRLGYRTSRQIHRYWYSIVAMR
jgi:ubiquinone/menaquinone biosynthesis C-methylase UbiE